MCLITFAWNMHPKYKLILAANRDEFYNRPTAKAAFWENQPEILGGKDLKAGGTWMTVHKNGRFAAVTNYRDLQHIREDVSSRGEIPTDFVNSNLSPEKFLQQLHDHSEEYNGFNVIVSDQREMGHYSNYERKINILKPGIYGLSNSLLDTPWPKVELAKEKFSTAISNSFDHYELLDVMTDTSIAPDESLPDTGISKEMERSLSAMCIRMENYGTCCSTVITIDRDGVVNFTEKSYPVGDRSESTEHFRFKIE